MINLRLTVTTVVVILYLKQVYSQCVLQSHTISCNKVSELPQDVAGISGSGDLISVTEIVIKAETTGNEKQKLAVNINAFQYTPNLKKLRISNYSIGILYPDTFPSLSIESIFLRFDDIHLINPRTFTNLSRVKKISLEHNLLKVIRRGIIGNSPQLTDLHLGYNEITSIEISALENIPNLKKLLLNNNKIDNIFVHQIISHPEKLEILWLHNNFLTLLTNFMLQRLTNLKIINLGFNMISVIESNTFEQTPNLQTLVLTHNNLKIVDGDIFPRKGNSLQRLYIDNNSLMFLSSSFFFRLNDLRKITLVGNPWFCSCLDIIERILHENGILQACQGIYSTGKRPVCVIENGTSNCNYVYNDVLSEKFRNYKIEYPVIIRSIDCIL